jgi:ATP/maltotriose-dependent transcriptional regulator MalT
VLALAMKGETDQARARVSDLPDDPSTVSPQRHGELRARGFAKMVGDDLPGATRDLLTVAAALRFDPTPERLVALGGAAEAQFRSGDWPSSLVNAEQAVSLAEDSEQVWALGFLHTPPVLVLAGQGRWAEAEHHLARAAELAAVVKDEATSAYVADVRVHLDLCRGDAAAAENHGRPILLRRARAPWEPGVMHLPVNYTTALVHLGRLEEAAILLQRFEERARATHRLSTLCALTRVRGELAVARRDTAGARAAFDEAIELIGVADALEVGMVRLVHGRFRRRRGERRGAEEELTQAREAFGRLGATPWIERTDAELALLGGHRPRAAPPGKVDPLTPQERLVAELVCGGRTNQMVAEELVLSVKTVSYHLSNVYTKLDVHSRTQLAAHPEMRPRDPHLH